MKRGFLLLTAAMVLLRPLAHAQDAPVNPAGNAAAIAAKESADERYNRLASDLQSLQADNEALHAKVTTLEQQVQTLRDAQSHPSADAAGQDDIKRLSEKITEVDRKRQEDKQAISEQIRKSIGGLERTLGSSSSSPAPNHSPSAEIKENTAAPAATGNGYSYTIKSGDRLDLILHAYNVEYKSKGLKPVTMRQAMDANPSVDWKRLLIGQKIVVPRPDGG